MKNSPAIAIPPTLLARADEVIELKRREFLTLRGGRVAARDARAAAYAGGGWNSLRELVASHERNADAAGIYFKSAEARAVHVSAVSAILPNTFGFGEPSYCAPT